jgi:FkbM family methyltransferase
MSKPKGIAVETRAQIKRQLKKLAESAGYNVDHARTQDVQLMCQRTFLALLYQRLDQVGTDFFFVQIGANDGVSFDWLYKFVTENRLQGLVVEPLKDFFALLCENYKAYPSVIPVNCASHRTEREVDVYRVDPSKAESLPDWTKGIASVDPSHHLRTGTDSEYMITERVNCITLDELFKLHSITHVDYLQIDVEGYDSEIIEMIDFNRIKPSIIRFEHQLESGHMSQESFRSCFELLNNAGYYLLMDRYDAVAYLPYW